MKNADVKVMLLSSSMRRSMRSKQVYRRDSDRADRAVRVIKV